MTAAFCPLYWRKEMQYGSEPAVTMDEIPDQRAAADPITPAARPATETLIREVGRRVRRARERKGISRRVLSERSGVSQRYLAQLEIGEGNISIARLLEVAQALDHRIEWLVGAEDPWNSEAVRVADLYRRADADTRQTVLHLLSPGAPAERRAHRVCLLGLRGAGKSTLGARLARDCDAPFVELNREIEALSGMPVEEVMALYGQEGYRRLEHQALDRVIETHERVVLAVAGGIVAEPETYALLLDRFHTIWLRASPEEHMGRVRAQGDERPMAGNPRAMDELRSILTSREALYARADAVLDTSGSGPDDSLRGLIEIVQRRGFLD
jgi:XRE family transcriptional regulator, aerobic/anaerobic benzoate catabolism transcriptional regulator